MQAVQKTCPRCSTQIAWPVGSASQRCPGCHHKMSLMPKQVKAAPMSGAQMSGAQQLMVVGLLIMGLAVVMSLVSAL